MPPRVEREALRFVRVLVEAGIARADGRGGFVAGAGARRAALCAESVRALAAAGVVTHGAGTCRPTSEARQWLRRSLLDEDAFAAQHRIEARRLDGSTINLAESPLARLGSALNGEPAFLAPHQVEAGERVRRLAERAQLQPRVTMSYSAAHTAGGGPSQAIEVSDMAADARRALGEIPRVLPRDCADVVLDVCGLLKGLQAVESERGWPRRSAKLVLRIGLEQLAQHYGLSAATTGVESRRPHRWLGEGARPHRFE